MRRSHAVTAIVLMIMTGAAWGTGTASAATPDWLNEINAYRSAAGLPAVADQPVWDAGIQNHNAYLAQPNLSQYMTGQYQSAHTENPSSPYYTPDGSSEAQRSDIYMGAVGWSPLNFIDGWFSGPFHAIGMLRPGLTQVAFAADATSGNAGLDVIGGLTSFDPPANPVLFPGNGMNTNLTTYGGTEVPDPLETCGWSNSIARGLPLIALLPAAPVQGLTAKVVASDGTTLSTANGHLCVVDQNTYRTSDQVYGPTGLQILQTDRAVILIADQPYSWNRQTVTISQPGKADIGWTFVTTPRGPVTGGHAVVVHAATGAQTVLGNVTITAPTASGYATVYPCAAGRPNASNVNFAAGQTVANFVVASSDANGDICIYTTATAHVIFDEVGATTAYSVHNATRMLDTRGGGAAPAAGTVQQVHVASGAQTILGNITVTGSIASGYVTAYPCAAGRPNASNLNFAATKTVANFVVASSDAGGNLCFVSTAATHIVFDQVGATTTFPVSNATRLVDTRGGAIPAGGTVVSFHAATGAQSVLGNLTVTGSSASGYATLYPCAAGRPNASNVNFAATRTVANFAVASSDGNGNLCVWVSAATHVIFDEVGTTTGFGVHNANRLLDTRNSHPFTGS